MLHGNKPKPQAFEDLIEQLSLPEPFGFDFVVVGDGSGTTAGNPGGYYAAVYEKCSDIVTELFGGMSHATNNTCEMSPFLHAFWFIQHARLQDVRGVRVLCVSDSEVLVKGARGEYARGANRHLWAGLGYFEEAFGVKPVWRHIPRNSHELHKRADAESKKMRKRFEDVLARRE